MVTDNDGILEPALKIGPDWPPAKLEAWANKELSSFGAVAKLAPYPSQAGRYLDNISFYPSPASDYHVAVLYFGDNGDWWVQHDKTPAGRELAYHVYDQLLGQGIALTVPDWMEKNLNLNAQAQAKVQEIPEKKKRRGRPRKQPASNFP